jgi:hypothetical protein
MPLSSFDFLSPKITLFYSGHNSHISRIGGLLSFIFLIVLILIIIDCLFQIINPQISSIFIYEHTIEDYKYKQSIDYSGINHFIQMYSNSGKGWFGDFDNKNILIYGIKENINIYNNDGNSRIDLYKTEHWVYDKCENIGEANKIFFSDISKTIKDYTKSICLRFYYNPYEQKYYQVGLEGYVPPNLETNYISEKRIIYKIIVEKCFNNSIFNDKLHLVCNEENEIENYLNLYNNIFIYFSNNQILPKNKNNPFEKYYLSISSTIQKMTFFENDIIFSPIKIISENNLFRSKKEDLSYVLKDQYHNDKYIHENFSMIGTFNFYFINNIIVYQRRFLNIIENLSRLGGFSYLLFFVFQIFNYISSRYTIIEDTKNLFKINAGIEGNNIDGNDIILDKMRHQNSQNYKIKVFNNNNIINNEDLNLKYTKNPQAKPKAKAKHPTHEHYGIRKSSKKNLGVFPVNTLYGKKNNYDNTKKTQTKYTNTFKQMVKQLTLKNKRKSFLSQGYLIKRKNYVNLSKNLTINDNEANNDKNSNNNLIDNNNNSSFLLLKDSKEKEYKEGFLKYDSKNLDDINNNSRKIKKKTIFKKNFVPGLDGSQIPQINIKKIDNNLSNLKGRHKSVNFGNQQGNFLFSANLLGLKNTILAKNPSENVIDSSKQVSNNQNKGQTHMRNSKFFVDKKTYEDNLSRPSVTKNENNLNTVIYNGNTEAASYLKTIIQSKMKLVKKEKTQNYNLVHFLEEKMRYFVFLKYIVSCKKREDNNITLISNFRNKLLSEEHLFKVHINLYLLEKLFQIDDQYKFDVKELYNNL